MTHWLVQIGIFLAAAVVAVPIAQRLRLGSVLGYLLAGVAIGPWGLRLITGVDNVLQISEFGVVMLLFVIGLEMQPRRLWRLRKAIVGFGGSQVAITSAVLIVAAWLLGLPLTAAWIVGSAMALSSTAFVLHMLAERGQLTTRYGRAAFAILLFQDLAVIPALALLPLLGAGTESVTFASAALQTAKVATAVIILVVGGHYLLRPIFRIVAATKMPEIFTAWALLVVIGTALLMERAGVPVALGAFAAGVLLAESEYRPALKANIDPFKNMLLGLFFIAVGMSLNVGLLLARPLYVLALTVSLLVIKSIVLYGLGRYQGLRPAAARSLASALPQGGEFAFVIVAAALSHGLFSQTIADQVVAVVILSMALTPLGVTLTNWVNRFAARPAKRSGFDLPEEPQQQVIIAGFGRVGQIVARLLMAKGVTFTTLEIDPEVIDFVRRYGDKIYYGDSSRVDLLRAAGAQDAKVFVLTIGDAESSLRTARVVRRYFPHLKIIAAARNRRHAHALMNAGVDHVLRETFATSLEIGDYTLRQLGSNSQESDHAVALFREYDERVLGEQAASAGNVEQLIQLRREAMQELEELFARDAEEAGTDVGSGSGTT